MEFRVYGVLSIDEDEQDLEQNRAPNKCQVLLRFLRASGFGGLWAFTISSLRPQP